MGSASRERVLKTMGKPAQARERAALKKRRRRPAKARLWAGPALPPPRADKASQVAAGAFCSLFRKAARFAAGAGLALRAEGNASQPVWRVYDRASGRELLSYLPHSRRWSAGGNEGGQVGGWRDALGMALSKKRCG